MDRPGYPSSIGATDVLQPSGLAPLPPSSFGLAFQLLAVFANYFESFSAFDFFTADVKREQLQPPPPGGRGVTTPLGGIPTTRWTGLPMLILLYVTKNYLLPQKPIQL
jgi:hypothetical protein